MPRLGDSKPTRAGSIDEIVQNATTGKRHVDKLVEVRRRDGAREWLLVHLEVQSQPDRHLPERMYEYHRRIVNRLELLLRCASTAVSLTEFERTL